MRYTETISIPWHTFVGEKPCPNRDIVVNYPHPKGCELHVLLLPGDGGAHTIGLGH